MATKGPFNTQDTEGTEKNQVFLCALRVLCVLNPASRYTLLLFFQLALAFLAQLAALALLLLVL